MLTIRDADGKIVAQDEMSAITMIRPHPEAVNGVIRVRVLTAHQGCYDGELVLTNAVETPARET